MLADGLGGHENGALAAQSVVDVEREHFRAAPEAEPLDLLAGIVLRSHKRINELAAELDGSPRSTCVLLHVGASEAVWAHAGDNRLYRFEEARLAERTLDHSVVELMRLRGRIDEERMKSHPDQNRLFEVLGGEHAPEFETGRASFSTWTGFLLASDGLWEHVSDAELEAVFEAGLLDKAVRELVARAKMRGGSTRDNIAAAAIRRGRAGGSMTRRLSRSVARRLGTIR